MRLLNLFDLKRAALHVLYPLLMIGTTVLAQKNYTPNILPPAPEAAALGKYIETPVSLYTGVPQINVPLTEVQQGSIAVPVSLSYHAGGNRVEDVASHVGLGWSLNAGGVITRIVRGLPDDDPGMGFLSFIQESGISYNYLVSGDSGTFSPLQNISDRCKDSEPDQYYFNFNGYKGAFTFDWNGQLIIDSDKKIEVNPTYDMDDMIIAWEIILDNGVQCSFATADYTGVQSYSVSCNAAGNYISSWYLTSITDVNGLNTVSFEYEDYPTYFAFERSESRSHLLAGNYTECSGSAAGESSYAISTMTHTGKRINRIHTTSGDEVLFHATHKRTDIDDHPLQEDLYSLDTVIIKNTSGETIRSYALGYDYSTDRLTLKSVTEFNGTESKPPYTFEYNQTKLPERTSKSKDHWGFHNNNTMSTLIPSAWLHLGYGDPVYFSGADRSPSEQKMKAGVLEKMTYPTGGFVEFEYEPHHYGYVRGQALSGFEESLKTAQVYAAGTCTITTCTDGTWSEDTVEIASSQPYVALTAHVTIEDRVDFPSGYGKPLVRIEDENQNVVFEYDESTIDELEIARSVILHLQLPPGTYVLKAFAQWALDGNTDRASANLYWNSETTIPKIREMAGGLRVKKVTESAFENDPRANIRVYEYLMPDGRSSGVLNGEPLYNYQYTSYQLLHPGVQEIPCNYYYRVAQSTASFGSTQGSHIGYREVTVFYGENGENGKSIQRFLSPYESPNTVSIDPPFPPPTSYSYKTGLLKESTDYKKEGSNYVAVKKSTVTYAYKETGVPALKVGFQGGNSGAGLLHKYDLGTYQVMIGHHKPIQKQETLYSMANGQTAYTIQSQYSYDTDYQNLLRQESNKSDGEQRVVTYYYVDDYTTITDPNHFIKEMADRNMRGIPVETVVKNGIGASEKVLSGEYRSFAIDNGAIYPSAIKTLETNQPLDDFDYSFDNANGTADSRYGEAMIHYEKYDSQGNIIQYTDRNGVTTAAQWGYGQKLPVASAINATADQIYYESFEEDDQATENASNARSGARYWNSGNYTLSFTAPADGNTYLMSYWYYDSGSWKLVQDVSFQSTISSTGSRIDDIRVYPEGAQMTTHTYQPGVGITSQSDANNSTIFYEYDDLGRLSVVMDHKKNILKTYEYQYAN